jgi:hypothetical protein
VKKQFHHIVVFLLAVLAGGMLASCASLDMPFPSGKSWVQPVSPKGHLRIGAISADKSSEWNSLEREMAGLLPLLLLEQGYAAAETAGCRIDASVIEREYLSGWKTKRSLSAEIRIWKEGEEQPFSAGKAMLSGDQSLASSKVLSTLLKLALSKALLGLEKGPEE